MSDSAKRAGFPWVIEGSHTTIPRWLAENGPLDERLHRHGAVLFRGFRLDDVGGFDLAAAAVMREPGSFLEESSPRTQLSETAYTSTDYPAKYSIQFHCEYSYADRWPGRLVFGCLTPPGSGGATLIADTRRVLGRLTEPQRHRFAEHGVRYRRNFTTFSGVPWTVAYDTDDRSEVERVCAERGIECRWSSAGLHTMQHGAAVIQHPSTGENCWFNHALIFNPHALEPASLRDALVHVEDDLRPSTTALGDGTPLSAEAIEEIRQAYADEAAAVEWRHGDVLVIDNMLSAHARAPYRGDRRIVVAMGDPVRRESLPAVTP